MCGIFALLNNNGVVSDEFIKKQFLKSKSRGPDNTILNITNDIYIGFHRLSINGLDKGSNQPFQIHNIELICNGEIYNYKELFNTIKYNATTNPDCEVIIYLYMLYGIEYTLNLLDGVFAFILIDYNIDKIFVSRDHYGVRPLYCLYNSSSMLNYNYDDCAKSNLIVFSSEVKQLSEFCEKFNNKNIENTDGSKDSGEDNDNNLNIKPVLPGEYFVLHKSESNKWFMIDQASYHTFSLTHFNDDYSEELILETIHDKFCAAVNKRVTTTNRPIACLLSGGLDSSIVTALVNKYYQHELETYSIGLKGSDDLLYAKNVANFLGTKHTEIIVSEDDFFDTIPYVIHAIESYDTTTVRASVGNYLVAKYISENSDAKVIFNGDGADELMGGYLYMKLAGCQFEFDYECKRLLKDLHFYDVLRSDRSISFNGLEARTPFLDREFVRYYLSISSKLRYDTTKKQEKSLFRKAFDKEYLPKEVLWRRKEAFSDGVSSETRSWHKIIEEKVQTQKHIVYDMNVTFDHNKPKTMEQLYYRSIYEQFYPNLGYLIPYFWMPKYVNAKDCSARVLSIYNKDNIEDKRELT